MNVAKHKVLIKKLAMLVISIFLSGLLVFGFEFFFSPYNYLPLNGKVEGKRYTWGHLVQNNKYGFRERDFKIPKPSDTYRVMVLGDSLTWGAGLDIEERYTAIAEKLLAKTFPERKFEVLNFGLPAAPTTRERDLLETFKREINPDLIVVGFCQNDPQPRSQDYSIERENLNTSAMGRALQRISQSLTDMGLRYTSKLLNDAFYRVAERLGAIPDWQTALARVYDPLSPEWQAFVQALTDIKRSSDELNLPPPIFAVLNPGGSGGRTLKLYSQWFLQAEKTAADIGFISYNHELEIADWLGGETLIINKLDHHPSATLNRVYGEKLYRVVAEQVLRQQ